MKSGDGNRGAAVFITILRHHFSITITITITIPITHHPFEELRWILH